jgi:hypothetical protein
MIMSRTLTPFAESSHSPLLTAALVFLFWLAAAMLVVVAQMKADTRLSAFATLIAIPSVAFLYTHTCARRHGASHALGVGTVWLVLSVIAEMLIATRLGHTWFALLGTPQRPLLRTVLLFVWVFSPVVFARRDFKGEPPS